MSERDSYGPGEFCWVDVSVPDTAAGAAFYKRLMGWDWEQGGPETGGYGTLTQRGRTVAGIVPTMEEGQPPAWSSYVSVADADATAKAVTDAGGSLVVEPMDVMTLGRMAFCQDPQGAAFGLWQPGDHKGAELVNEPGSWTWNQLATTDVKAAERFYGEVFGWSLAAPELDGGAEGYFNWAMEGSRWPEGIGGAMPIEGNLPEGTPPFWLVNLAVPDIAAAMETTEGAGGKALTGVIETPVGKLAGLLDPQGAFFSGIEPDYPEAR